jgi:hypothetical protein
MSVESIQAKIDNVLCIYDNIPEAEQLILKMYAEISRIQPPYETNGSLLNRVANEINITCDKAVIVERYVEKYYTEFGIHDELYESMRHLHDDIRRMKKSLL